MEEYSAGPLVEFLTGITRAVLKVLIINTRVEGYDHRAIKHYLDKTDFKTDWKISHLTKMEISETWILR